MKHLLNSLLGIVGMIATITPLLAQGTQPTASLAKGQPDCRRSPAFTRSTSIDPLRSAFSTSNMQYVGLIYTEVNLPNAPTPPNPKQKPNIYQHPSWKTAGYFGPMVIDPRGNIFLAPLPFVNLYRNKPSKQNMLYRVDPNSAELKPYFTLPTIYKPNEQNPYGVLGMGYDCEIGIIYASSVQGSDRTNERGRIYAIQTGEKPTILDVIPDVDAFGVGVFTFEGKKRMIYGEARTPEIYMVELASDGKFVGKPEFVLSLEGIGTRGDDRARKIRIAENGDITISGVEFYFNLIAPSERQETPYTFRYDPVQKTWVLTKIGH
ncbi:MAG: hypothetical protein JNN12_16575 [Bacteroidetes Order II. Incertae sedis bacterium]|nr:hypothetical protein [Bacteroidetes Order II. bacterium]